MAENENKSYLNEKKYIISDDQMVNEGTSSKEDQIVMENKIIKQDQIVIENKIIKEDQIVLENKIVNEGQIVKDGPTILEDEILKEDPSHKDEEKVIEDQIFKQDQIVKEDHTVKEDQILKEESVKSSDVNTTCVSESKGFISNIKDKVLKNSESTIEVPATDYIQEYTVLTKAKDVANKISKENNDIGLDAYFKVSYYLNRLIVT